MAKLQILEGLKVDHTEDGWSEFKKWLDGTYAGLHFSFSEDDFAYEIVAVDHRVYRVFSINKSDASDFETNFKSKAYASFDHGDFNDPRLIRRFGNLTASSTGEVLLCARGYTEQGSEAGRSVISTSNQDKPGGTGAAAVRITYLTSAYVLKTEDVTLDGTKDVDTVATDIRFIERFQVIQGAAAAGAIKLMSGTGGGGSEFCGIGVGTYDAFLCHHYVPAGREGWVYRWAASADDEVKLKLMGRGTYGANLVDEHWDLINLMGIATPPGLLEFNRFAYGIKFGERSYIRITAAPNQTSGTTVRGELIVWEQ